MRQTFTRHAWRLANANKQLFGSLSRLYDLKCGAAVGRVLAVAIGLHAASAKADLSPIVSMTAVPHASRMAAGSSLLVRCEGRRQNGEQVVVPEARIHAADVDETAFRMRFTTQKAGRHRIACRLAGTRQQPAVSSPPVDIVVTSALPHAMRVRLYRQGKCFTQGARLPLVWRVVDRFGNDIEDASVDLTTSPEVNVRRDKSGGFIIDDEVAVEATLTPRCVGCARLSPQTLPLVVDSTAPHIEIYSPKRGEMRRGELTPMRLLGEVKDGLGSMANLTFFNQPYPLDSHASRQLFEVPYTPRWGVNILDGSVEDACGNVGIVRQSFLASNDWSPLATAPSEEAQVKHAVEVAFSQALWDDEDRATSHDVSTLIQMALDNSDLGERLPTNLASWPDPDGTAEIPEVTYHCGLYTKTHKQTGYQIRTDGKLSYSQPIMEYVRAIEGGWHIAMSLRDVRLPVIWQSTHDLGCMGSQVNEYRAVVVADSIRIEATPQVVMEHGEPSVQLCDDCLHIDFGDEYQRPHIGAAQWGRVPIPSAILQFIDWWLAKRIGRLKQPLAEKVRQELTGELETFLRGLRLEHSLPLPHPVGGEVLIHSGVDEVKLHGKEGEGGGTFSLYGQFYTQKIQLEVPKDVPLAAFEPRGAIKRPPTARPLLTLAPRSAFALSVHDDLVNQMLHSIWASGALAHDNVRQLLLPQSGVRDSQGHQANLLDAAKLRIFFSTPPVLMPGDKPGTVQLGLGDVYAEADLDTYRLFGVEPPEGMPHLTAAFFFSALLNAQLELDPQTRQLKVTPIASPRILLQAVKNPTPSMEQSVNYWLEKQLNRSVPRLLASVLGAFPLPELQVGRINGVPDNLVWVLDEGQLSRESDGDTFELQGALKAARRQRSMTPAP